MNSESSQTQPSACESPQHVKLLDLDLRKSPRYRPIAQLTGSRKRKGHLAPEQASKRHEGFQMNSRLSDSCSPRWSRGSTPSSVPDFPNRNGGGSVERHDQEDKCIQSKGETGHDVFEELKDPPRMYNVSEYEHLCTPPLTMSECSSKHSVASSAQYISSPQSTVFDDHDFIDGELTIPNGFSSQDSMSDCRSSVGFKYPPTIDLCQEQSPTQLHYIPWSHIPFVTHSAEIFHYGNNSSSCCVPVSDTSAAPFGIPQFVICGADSSPHPAEIIDLSTPPPSGDVEEPYNSEVPMIQMEEIGPDTYGEPPSDTIIDPENFSSTAGNTQPRFQSSNVHTDSLPTEVTTMPSATTGVKLSQEGSPLDLYLKKNSIQDWSLDIPEDINNLEIGDIRSPSTTILMTMAEEDLEERVYAAIGDDYVFSEALLANLKEKLPFILPLFCGEDCSPFDFSHYSSSFAYGTDTERGSGSSSAPSSETKSSAGVSVNTSATSSGSSKKNNRDDDESITGKEGKRSLKRLKVSQPGSRGVQERRRLRCHFHAKCPISHTKKTCVMSGWGSIHHLRGHFESHHTTIRCNKCFQEFQGPNPKTEKNRHQRACKVDATPPRLEVIDCDKKDELDESLGSFRTWQLQSEEDEEMKNWIVKYKAEFVTNNAPTDEAHDSRELAKWFRIWQTLFPDSQTPVPSPFQDASILPADLKVERWLEIFQSVVETKIKQDSKPPAELPQHIEYYKESIRQVFKMMFNISHTNSSGNMFSRSGSTQQADTHSVSTPANSSNTSAPAFHTPSSGRGPEQQSERQVKPGTKTSAPQNDFSVTSPYSAETKGAYGESPVIMRSAPRCRSLGSSTSNPSLNSRPQNREVPRSNISLQILNTESPQTRAMSRSPMSNLMPPLLLRQRSSVSPSHSHTREPAQNYQESVMDFTLTNNVPAFNQSVNQNMNLADINFLSLPHDQGNPMWPNAVPRAPGFRCQYCMDSGFVTVENGSQPCLTCGVSYGIQS